MNIQEDTIAAIATPIGVGGLSVIRVSGKRAIEVVEKVFSGKQKLTKVKTFTASFGRIIRKEETHIDEVIVTVFREPHSYTAENMVEISCHGGIYVTKQILNAVLEAGARLAMPGEFTKRAFLNGRIDLAQAEAVADIIQANSEQSHRASINQLEGMLSNEIIKYRDRLLNLCSTLELELDFVEEDLEFQSRVQLGADIDGILDNIKKLIDSYSVGKVFREGVRVAVVGKPNVGKSSILNILLNENRSIVTDIPGTTRDIIEENIIIDGILFNIVDTAGVRNTTDPIESEGVLRARKQIELADVIVIVLDHTQGFTSGDKEIFKYIDNCCSNQTRLVIINKIDIPVKDRNFENEVRELNSKKVSISAKTGEGLKDLKRILVNIVLGDKSSIQEKSVMITNTRHKESLIKAYKSLLDSKRSLQKGLSNEFIAVDIRAALDHLGEIVGEVTTDDILNNIFSRFCIGK